MIVPISRTCGPKTRVEREMDKTDDREDPDLEGDYSELNNFDVDARDTDNEFGIDPNIALAIETFDPDADELDFASTPQVHSGSDISEMIVDLAIDLKNPKELEVDV